VKLNARSTITYNTDFGVDERRVILEGEGFFDVKKNPDTRFVVTAPGMEVAVHGTKFNIYAYPDREFSEMSLLEGSVTLYSGESALKVAPNEKVYIDRCTGRVNLRKTDNKVETACLKKTLVFMHEPLYRVVDMLERRFGVHIECSDEISMSDIYTGTFRDRSIYDILEVLRMHYGFIYEVENNRITIRTNNN
jgi:ferric-dicitrate binding protein FerR (iron transport regulator)